jgi:membrane-associated protease RseP (regulator of RpoE activity)
MIFLCTIIFIILFHEAGHLLAAKACKCGVKTFSVGFGKPLFKFTYKKTIYQFSPLLLGGFCELQDEMNYSRSKYAFTNKTYSQKLFIAFAGILVNLITGLISYYLFSITHNKVFFVFAYYSIIIGLSNALPIPALDGSFWIAFLFEKKLGKKKCYEKIKQVFTSWFKWIMILNILSIPYLIYLISIGKIL